MPGLAGVHFRSPGASVVCPWASAAASGVGRCWAATLGASVAVAAIASANAQTVVAAGFTRRVMRELSHTRWSDQRHFDEPACRVAEPAGRDDALTAPLVSYAKYFTTVVGFSVMSDFGRNDPRELPPHFLFGAVRIDYATAVRADTEKQNCSICPRYWYVDAVFRCARCDTEFTFSAAEQRAWYEDYGFWVDSRPTRCSTCRRTLRELTALRREYDRSVAEVLERGDLDGKKRLAAVIDQLYEMDGPLPPRINETRRRLGNELQRSERFRGGPNDPH